MSKISHFWTATRWLSTTAKPTFTPKDFQKQLLNILLLIGCNFTVATVIAQKSEDCEAARSLHKHGLKADYYEL
jgi:hypothetical protein